jgi:hypothetical protein
MAVVEGGFRAAPRPRGRFLQPDFATSLHAAHALGMSAPRPAALAWRASCQRLAAQQLEAKVERVQAGDAPARRETTA